MGNKNTCLCYKDNKSSCYICKQKYCSACGKSKETGLEHKHMCRNCYQVLTFKKSDVHDCKCKDCSMNIGSYPNKDTEIRYCHPCYARKYGFTCHICNKKGVKTDIHNCLCIICKKEKIKTTYGSCTSIIEFDEKNNINKLRNVCLPCIEKRNSIICKSCNKNGLKGNSHICICVNCGMKNVNVNYGQEDNCNLCRLNKNIQKKAKYNRTQDQDILDTRRLAILSLKIKGEDILTVIKG